MSRPIFGNRKWSSNDRKSPDLGLDVSFLTLGVFYLTRLTFVTFIYLKACPTGMLIVFAGELRQKLPAILMGCQLLEVPINKLNRSKLTNVLKTAKAHDDIIINCEDEQFARMNMETANRLWTEVCNMMKWKCKDHLVLIGGNGDICEPIRTLRPFMKTAKIEDLEENFPILFDTDWFEKVAEFGNKKRTLAQVSWSDESLLIQQPKKAETEQIFAAPIQLRVQEDVEEKADQRESQVPDLNSSFEDLRLQSQQMLEEQRQEYEQKMKEMAEHHEKRIKNLYDHNEFVSRDTENREKQNELVVSQLETKLRLQEHENMAVKQNLAELQSQVQNFGEQKQYWQTELTKLRDIVQSQNSTVQKEVKQEVTAADVTFGSVDMDSDDDGPIHSSLCRPGRRINALSKGIPTSLGKLGMTVFNPAKQSKIEYLNKFMLMMEDFATEAEDFKVVKQLVYQAFADDRNFRIHDLTTDDKSSLQKLARAIILQDDGDSIDMMKTFESEQLKHGETHLNYLNRVCILYEFATNFSDQKWKEEHVHAQKIYNKIDDSLPTIARSKFRELMIADRKASTMTIVKIRACLDTVLLIYGDEIKAAMGSQRHIVPMVDAIHSKSKPFPQKNKGFVCWNCGKEGHMRRNCTEDKGNKREPKTSGRKDSIQCYSCQGYGHVASECPKGTVDRTNGRNRWSDRQNSGHNKWSYGSKKDQ